MFFFHFPFKDDFSTVNLCFNRFNILTDRSGTQRSLSHSIISRPNHTVTFYFVWNPLGIFTANRMYRISFHTRLFFNDRKCLKLNFQKTYSVKSRRVKKMYLKCVFLFFANINQAVQLKWRVMSKSFKEVSVFDRNNVQNTLFCHFVWILNRYCIYTIIVCF